MGGTCIHLGEEKHIWLQNFSRKNWTHETPSQALKENIKMDHKEIKRDNADWIRLDQNVVQWRKLMNTV
jgi:hypothetical protein